MVTRHYDGFTLIEVLLYLALFGIIMGGLLVCVRCILDSLQLTNCQAIVRQEGEFILAKIDWAISQDQNIVSPALGSGAVDLAVNKWGFDQNPVYLNLTDGGKNLCLSFGAPAAGTCPNDSILNSGNIIISGLRFTHLSNPEGVKVEFTLSAGFAEKNYAESFSDEQFLGQ